MAVMRKIVQRAVRKQIIELRLICVLRKMMRKWKMTCVRFGRAFVTSVVILYLAVTMMDQVSLIQPLCLVSLTLICFPP
jgi:predicted signal transduction protein with EAL and GGDEF domain